MMEIQKYGGRAFPRGAPFLFVRAEPEKLNLAVYPHLPHCQYATKVTELSSVALIAQGELGVAFAPYSTRVLPQ